MGKKIMQAKIRIIIIIIIIIIILYYNNDNNTLFKVGEKIVM